MSDFYCNEYKSVFFGNDNTEDWSKRLTTTLTNTKTGELFVVTMGFTTTTENKIKDRVWCFTDNSKIDFDDVAYLI